MAAADEDDELDIDARDLQMEGVIGEGSTAVVYKGCLHGEPVAVKEIRAWAEEVDDQVVQMVQRELMVLNEVNHPHILRFLGLVRDSEPLRIVFEYCAGGSLFELLHHHKDIPLSWAQRLQVLIQTAQAMDYIHGFDPPVIHRDLKSLNLMLLDPITTQMPHIKLADFGLARVQERAMTQGVGTKHWMAPEVLKGTTYTEKADVFSFSMVAFEDICRRVPYERMPPQEVARLLSSGSRPDVTEHVRVAEVPAGLLDLVYRCWDQDPGKRPAAAEICQSLARVQANYAGAER
mmetsp:Transcript_77835/g.204372  ORF Transcript_77835/g.204372 Transcript_77835/m.204372 type:complete len:291 (-) Transcript_77835:123-995(-)